MATIILVLRHNLILGYMAGWGVAEPVENFGGSLLPEATTYACKCSQTTLLAEAIIQYASTKIVAADSTSHCIVASGRCDPLKYPRVTPKLNCVEALVLRHNLILGLVTSAGTR